MPCKAGTLRSAGQEYFIRIDIFSGGSQRRLAALCFRPQRRLKLPRNGRCSVPPAGTPPLHKYDNEPHCGQGVQAGNGQAETKIGPDAVRRELDVFDGHRTSPRSCPSLGTSCATAEIRSDLSEKIAQLEACSVNGTPGSRHSLSRWQIEQGDRDQAQYHLSRIAAICGTGCEEYRSLAAALEKPPGTGLVY